MPLACLKKSPLPEQRLVLAACQSNYSDRVLRPLIEAADPRFTLQLADELGLLGFVSGTIHRQSNDRLWHTGWMSNLGRNMMLVEALCHWVNILRSHALDPIAFKGVVLGKQIFDHFSQRDACDLDIIIPFRRFYEAIAVLRQHGATAMQSELGAPRDKLGALTFIVPSADNTYTIDLHAGWVPRWGSASDRTIPEPETTVVDFYGVPVKTLGPKLLYIHTVLHMFQHYFSLKTLLDATTALRYVRRLNLEDACNRLAQQLGPTIAEKLKLAKVICAQFVANGESSSIPWGQGTALALATPSTQKRERIVWSLLQERDRHKSGLQFLQRALWPRQEELVGGDIRKLTTHRVIRLFRVASKCSVILASRILPGLFLRPTWRSRANH